MPNYFDKYDESSTDFAMAEFEPARQNYFDKYGEPDTAIEEIGGPDIQDVDPTWGDYGRIVMSGGAQIGSGIGWLFDSTEWGQSLKETGQEASEWWLEDLSSQAKASLQVEFTKRDRGDLWTDAKWNRAKLTAMQSLLGTMAGMGVGSVLTKGLGAAGMRTAVTTATGAVVQAPSKVAGMIGYGLGEAAVAAPSVGAGVEREIAEMSHEDLYANAADYQAIYDALENQDPVRREERAKELLAKAAAGDASALALVSTFVLSAPFGSMMAKMTAGLPLTAGGGRLAGAARGAAGEAGQEFLQSGAEKMAENIGIRQADPSRGITTGALEEAVGGALAGGIMGGGVGVAADPTQAPVTPVLPDEESPLAALAAGGEAPTPADELTDTLGTILDESAQLPDKDELDDALEDAYRELGIATKTTEDELAQQAVVDQMMAEEEAATQAQEEQTAADEAALEQAVEDIERDVQESAERRAKLLPVEEVQRDAQLQKQRDVAFEKAEAAEVKEEGRVKRETERGFEEMEAAGREEAGETEIALGEAGGVGVARAKGEMLGEKIQAEIQKAQPLPTAPDKEVSKAPELITEPVDKDLAALVSEQEAAQKDFDTKPGLSARRRLKKATAAVETYEPAKAAEVDDESAEVGDIPGLEDIEVEAAASTENDQLYPTEAQIEAYNFKKARIKIKGMQISIENPASDTSRGGTEHYGQFDEIEGADGDKLDVFVNPEIQTDYDNKVFVIDQMEQDTGQFDEHKVMLGYTNQLAAVRAYKKAYDKGWRVGPVTELDMPAFKKWTQSRAKLTRPLSGEEFFGKQSRMSGRAAKGKGQEPQRVGRQYRFAKKQRQMELFDTAKSTINAPNQKYVGKVLSVQPGQQKTGKETASMNQMVSHLITLQDRSERFEQQLPAEPAAYTQQNLVEDTQALRDSMPGADVVILDSYKSAPKSVREAMEADNSTDVSGVTNPQTGEIYLFADQIENNDEAARTVIHEATHQGLRVAFGDQLDSKLENLFKNVPNKFKPGLQDIVDKYHLDVSEREDRLEAAEELLAHIAEHDPKNNIIQDLIAKIKQMLRNMGFDMKRWTDEEIVSVIKEARGSLARRSDRIAGITFDEDVVVDETGEVFTIEQDAEEMLAQLNKRQAVCERIQNCL